MTSPITLPSFLEKHLDAIAKSEGIFDYSIEYSAGSKHGDGFMAAVLAVSLKGSQKSAGNSITPKHLSLICKLMPENKARQDLFSGAIVFSREVHFYNNILPIFQRVQKEHDLRPETGFFGYPHCYVAVANAETNEYIIIMRDLRVEGYTLWNKLEPITFEKVFLLMEQLGRMHGLAFVIREKYPELFQQICDLSDIMKPLCTNETMKGMMDKNYEQTMNMLDNEEHKAVVSRVKASWEQIMIECVNGDRTEPFAVMNHGDCWNNNFMFSHDKICVLDWQVCRYASPAMDLVYFFMTSTNKALRDQHYDQLLQVYHKNLTNIIHQCGVRLEKPFKLDDLHAQMRKYGKFGIVMAPLLLQVIVTESDKIMSMDEMADSIKKDGESAMNMFATFDEVSTRNYRTRLGDAIEDAKRLGWI